MKGVVLELQGFRIRGPYYGTIPSTLDRSVPSALG